MRCIVTGGAGFLGSYLTEQLVMMGHSVVVIDDMFRGKKKNLQGCTGMDGYHLIMGDAANRASYEKAADKMGGVDCVYHLAAINGTRWFHERPDFVVQVNLDTLRTALDFTITRGARFVFTSSPEAFGEQPEMPLTNDSNSLFSSASKHGRHSYGASKYLGEILVQHAVSNNSLDARIVRPFNAYGPRLPGDAYGQVTGIFLEQCHKGKPITVHGDGSQTRSFCFVDDLLAGMMALMNHDDNQIGPVNIGNPIEKTMLELAEAIIEVTDSRSTIEHRELPKDDPTRRCPNIDKAKATLGWEPQVDLKDGLQKTVEYYREQLAKNG